MADDKIKTWAQFMAATPEQRRRCLEQIFREWEQDRIRELAEDEKRDNLRGRWGD